MEIKDLRQLNKLIALCHKTGVEKIRVGDIELTLGTPPVKKGVRRSSSLPNTGVTDSPTITPYQITEDTPIETEGLTEEQMLMWSVNTHAEAIGAN